MQDGLFIPCYVDQLYPDVGMATVELLERHGAIIEFPSAQTDECCGFGGAFAVSEEAASCVMGNDRIRDHENAGTEILTAGDMSCLMHLQGWLRRQKKRMQVMHVAQILAGRTAS